MTAIFFLSCLGATGVYLLVTGSIELAHRRKVKKLMRQDWRKR